MGNKFFQSWETWEKLVFILACAIVVTMILGCGKLLYTHWRLRKYTVLEKEKKEQAALQRQMSQHRTCNRAGSDTVPFGIRVLESGAEVEGVWRSPANTTKQRSRDSSVAPSPFGTASNSIDMGTPGERTFCSSNTMATPSTKIGVERQAGCLSVSHDLDTGAPSSDHLKSRATETQVRRSTRGRYPPPSFTRYNSNPYVLRRQSSATSTLQDQEATQKVSVSITGNTVSTAEGAYCLERSAGNSGDVKAISASTSDTQRTRWQSRHVRPPLVSNMSLLDGHRISQAAENGQLTAHCHRSEKAHSLDFATPPMRAFTSENSMENRRSEIAQRSHIEGFEDQALPSAKLAALPLAVRRSSMPDVTPFTQFCKTAPPSPKLDRSTSSSMESIQEACPKADSQKKSHSSLHHPTSLASQHEAEPTLPPTEHGSFEKQPSPVVRGLGSGFEILRPGTLIPSTPSECGVPMGLNNASPWQTKRTPGKHKLQKIQRLSIDSTRSSRSSRRSRISLLLSGAA